MEELILGAATFVRAIITWLVVSEMAPWVIAFLAAGSTLGYDARGNQGWWRTLWNALVAGLVTWGVVWFIQQMVALSGWV